jgi:myo-inositol-1-phosphate synthase
MDNFDLKKYLVENKLNEEAKKKTAVEWLEDEVDRIIETYDVDMMRSYLEEAYEQAKEMEKEHISEAWDSAYGGDSYYSGESYYNETFK